MDFTARRHEMVARQLEGRDISDARVLEKIGALPRELFLPPEMSDQAYEDRAVPVGYGQTISQPYIVAFMTQLLHTAPDLDVLEIGTGTGYQTALLAMLSRRVYTVERIEALATAARERIERLGLTNVSFRVGDGSEGWAEHAPTIASWSRRRPRAPCRSLPRS